MTTLEIFLSIILAVMLITSWGERNKHFAWREWAKEVSDQAKYTDSDGRIREVINDHLARESQTATRLSYDLNEADRRAMFAEAQLKKIQRDIARTLKRIDAERSE